MRRLFILTSLMVGVLSGNANAFDEKQPVPDEVALKKSLAVIEEAYAADYKALRSNEQRAALAKKLLRDAAETKDSPVDRYALLKVSRDIAAKSGDWVTAYASIQLLAKGFDVDALQAKADALETVAKASASRDHHQTLALLMVQLADQAVTADRYEIATGIARSAQASARRTRIPDIAKQVAADQKRIQSIGIDYKKLESSRELLKESPTDPDANLAIGRFLCLAKKNWEAGAPMLALCNDEKLKRVATLEVAEKPDALALGDAWWDAAEELKGDDQRAARERAATWYQIAFPNLKGLSRSRVETRIKDAPADSRMYHLVHFADNAWQAQAVAPSKATKTEAGHLVLSPGSNIRLREFYAEFQAVRIRGKIQAPGKDNLRFQVGPIYGIFNWEHGGNLFFPLIVAPPGVFMTDKKRSRVAQHPPALASGKMHDITIVKARNNKISVIVDGKVLYSRDPASFFGTLSVFPGGSSRIELQSITVIGRQEPGRQYRGWSHY